MLKQFSRHLRDEDGAVTVDWVVLTAALVGLGVAMITVIGDGAMSTSTSVGNRLSSLSCDYRA